MEEDQIPEDLNVNVEDAIESEDVGPGQNT